MSAPSHRSDDGRLTHKEWKQALEDDVLLGQACADCGHETAAPKAACARCGSRDVDAVELPTAGTVYTETTVSVAPQQFGDDAPYTVAIVTLGDARVMARVEGTVDIGDDVRLQGHVEADGEVAPLFG